MSIGYRKANRHLKKFLREHKALTKFKWNCSNVVGSVTLGSAISLRLLTNISSHFVWSKTPEGYKFWRALDDKFKSLR